MASLNWTWQNFWDWFRQIEDDAGKSMAMTELIKDGWLANCSANIQAEVMLHAPMEILQSMKHFPHIFKLEAIQIIQMKLDKQAGVRRKKPVYSFGL